MVRLNSPKFFVYLRRYRIGISKSDFEAKDAVIKQLIQLAYENENG